MVGIVKKIDGNGFGIIACADGSKIPFIRADIRKRRDKPQLYCCLALAREPKLSKKGQYPIFWGEAAKCNGHEAA